MVRDPAFVDLVEAYASGELVLFAGSGVSVLSGLPTYTQLVKVVVDRVHEFGADHDTRQSIEALIRAYRFGDVLVAAREFLGEAEFVPLIRRTLDNPSLEVSEIARTLAELRPNLHAVLTTNLDSVLERAFGWPVPNRVTPDILNRAGFILKLHGSVTDPSTWVLLPEDQAHAMYRDPEQRPPLRQLLLNRPMLFVGTSLASEEPSSKYLLELVQSDRAPRFALMPANQITPSERRRLGAAGIRLIGYSNEGGHHEGLSQLLRDLSEDVKRDVEHARPLERQAREAAVMRSSPVLESFTEPFRSEPHDGSGLDVPLTQASARLQEGAPLESFTEPFRDEPHDGSSIDVPPFRFSIGLARVLDVALHIRAQRKERDAALSSSALLFALVEAGRLRLQEGEPASTRWLFERAVSERYNAELAEYLIGPLSFTRRPFGDVRRELATVSRTPNVLNLFPFAASLAKRASGSPVISTRHLLGALFAERQAARVSNSLLRLTASAGLDIARLRADFLTYVKAGHPSDNEAVWREALLGGQPQPSGERFLPGYSSDDVSGKDMLQLEHEIAGFASVIASVDLVPPLSIGLFGSWGSGKSFFMKKLRVEIDAITTRAAKGGPESKRFCRSIVPIEFNAWHYAEANLWASLVDHIFQSLSDHLLGKEKAEKQAVARLFEELETSKQLRDEAQRELDKAKGEQQSAEGELAKRVEEEQKRASSLKGLLAWDLWKNVTLNVLSDEEKAKVAETAKGLGLPVISRSPRELKAVLEESRTVAGRTKLLASSLLLRPRPHLILLAFSLGLPVLLGIAYAVAQTDAVRAVAAMASSVSLWLGGVMAWAKKQLDRTSSLLDSLDSVDKKVADQLARESEKHRGEVEAAERRLEEARIAVSMAGRRLEQAEERVRAAQLNLEENRPERRIARFIQERVGSDDYRKHLGVVATVRRDFQRLSSLMYPEQDSGMSALPPAQPELPHIDRIVLYVDDLDRCPPARVVEVLEAVHLLLAFKLFVVVVGVDSRWMLRSLLERYPGLLVDERVTDSAGPSQADVGAGSHDYLEKIFQIPYWLRPMDPGGAFRLISGLVVPSAEPVPSSTQAGETAPEQVGEGETPSGPAASGTGGLIVQDAGSGTPLASGGGVTEVITPAKPDGQEAVEATPPVSGGVVESAAQRLDIHHLELEFMQGLAPFVGNSPRRVKRFVNIYRLFKASLPPGAHATFIKRGNVSGDHLPVLVLLAIITGAPRFAPEWLRQLLSTDPESRVRALVDSLKDSQDSERRVVVGALGLYIQMRGEDVSLQELADWAPQIGRYSFAAVTSAHGLA